MTIALHPLKGPAAPSFFDLYGGVLGWISMAILRYEASHVERSECVLFRLQAMEKRRNTSNPFHSKTFTSSVAGSLPRLLPGPGGSLESLF